MKYRIAFDDPGKPLEKLYQFFSTTPNVEEEVQLRMIQEKMSPFAVAYVWETKEVLAKTIVRKKDA